MLTNSIRKQIRKELESSNVKQVSIDCLPLRKGVCKEFKYHNVNSVSRHSKHIHLVDMYDNSKLLSSMASRKRKRCVNQVSKRWYQISVNNGEYTCKVKENHLLSKCKDLTTKGVKYSVKPM